MIEMQTREGASFAAARPDAAATAAAHSTLAVSRAAPPLAGLALAPLGKAGAAPVAPSARPSIRRTLANIEWGEDEDDHSWFIQSATADRSGGTSGGAHATSYGVFVDTALYAVRGKSFDDAIANLLALCDEVVDLPAFKDAKASDANDRKVKKTEETLAEIKADKRFQDLDKKSDMVKTQIVQALFKSYLDLRNAAPGVLIPGLSGKKSKGAAKSEKDGINQMSSVQDALADTPDKEPNRTQAKKFAAGAWEAFDDAALTDPTNTNAADWAKDNCVAVANHLVSCSGYPDANRMWSLWTDAFMVHLTKDLDISRTHDDALRTAVSAKIGDDIGERGLSQTKKQKTR